MQSLDVTEKNASGAVGAFLNERAKIRRAGVTHCSLRGVNWIINETEKQPPGERREEGKENRPCKRLKGAVIT